MGGLANSSLLVVDAATLSGTLAFIEKESQAMAVSRVHSAEPLQLSVEFNPDPVQPDELLDAQISLSNPTGSPTGQLSLQVLWPEHINIQQLHAAIICQFLA